MTYRYAPLSVMLVSFWLLALTGCPQPAPTPGPATTMPAPAPTEPAPPTQPEAPTPTPGADDCPDEASAHVTYTSRDTSFCQRARIGCAADQKPFNDACGCGCVAASTTPGCPDEKDPKVSYVDKDPSICARTKFGCEDDQKMFFGECGCGCISP